jgi:hypothetical protein
MSEGRCPLLLHTCHPFQPFSSSPRASARPSVKLFHATRGIESSERMGFSQRTYRVTLMLTKQGDDHIQRSPGFYTVSLMLRSPHVALSACVYVCAE